MRVARVGGCASESVNGRRFCRCVRVCGRGSRRVSRRWVTGMLVASTGPEAVGHEVGLKSRGAREGGLEAREGVESEGRCTGQTGVEVPPTYVKAEGRVVAVGDLHGDLPKALKALKLAGVLHEDDDGTPIWCGGNTTIVQLGDVLDRGDCEIGILMLLRDLGQQAEKEGGGVYMINGNHESLNVCGNFRYVTRGAFYESALAAGTEGRDAAVWENQLLARVALYSPGGLIAKELARNPTVLVVNDTVFAHGGLLPTHVEYGLEKINAEMAAWMRGDSNDDGSKATPPYVAMGGPNSVMWNRTLSQEKFKSPYDRYYACSMLKSTMEKVGGKRLVVGHTPQITGCNCECGGQIWRTDVGMSRGVLNASPQVLSIDKKENGETQVQVLSDTPWKDSGSLPSRRGSNNMKQSRSVFGLEILSQTVAVRDGAGGGNMWVP